MPRVHERKAAKDYPDIGVKKGERYFTWAIKRQRGGVVRRSKTYPKPQQLTENPYYIALYDIGDAIDAAEDYEGLMVVKDDAESLRDELQEKLENMPEGLQRGSTGELLQERIDAVEELITAFGGLEEPSDDADCEDCDGTGHVGEGADTEGCETCDGTGKVQPGDDALEDMKEELRGAMPG